MAVKLLLYIPETKVSNHLPLYFIPLYEVTATNKVALHFLYFLSSCNKQVTLEAVPSIPAKFQQETFPIYLENDKVYYKLNIYHKVLLKLNKTLISTYSNFLIKKRSLIRFQLFQPLIWSIAQLVERFL